MRIHFGCVMAGVAVVATSVLGTWLIRQCPLRADNVLATYQEDRKYDELTIEYPLDETLFPPEIIPPTFRWRDGNTTADAWAGRIEFADGADPVYFLALAPEWTPSEADWERIKRRSRQKTVKVTIVGIRLAASEEILSRGAITMSTSSDEVGSPLFYREVNLPFSEAVKDPAAQIRWRFGVISSKKQPGVILERLPVCGNCHSFSADGSVLGMDVDYANERGSYAITAVGKQTSLDDSKIITWSDYRREDGEQTFGLLSQVSPDGRYVASTVKDRSVFVAKDDLAFSQLFFPLKGILAIYDRETKRFFALPGADNKEYVQSNPAWSPDGKTIVFTRQKAYELEGVYTKDSALLTPEECREFLTEGKTFLYDLYRIPFNDGRGGEPEPLEGASRNGASNYFPKYSPDGEWIVFCKAKSFMLLQPDSELYIVAAEGGEARRLRCNTPRMNSWHSWSPNGKWLVFSSKANSPYTQLFLTHIDEAGESTPPVVLSHFTSRGFAANIPEFVNTAPEAIETVRVAFLNVESYFRAGNEKLRAGDLPGAEALFQKALKLDSEHAGAHANLAVIRLQAGKRDEAIAHCRDALRIDPKCFVARLNLGRALQETGDVQESMVHLSEAERLQAHDIVLQYHLGLGFQQQGKHTQAVVHYTRALDEQPDSLPPLFGLAWLRATSRYHEVRDAEVAVKLATNACKLTQYRNPAALDILAAAHASAGRYREAVQYGTLAAQLARRTGKRDFADAALRRVDRYARGEPFIEGDSP